LIEPGGLFVYKLKIVWFEHGDVDSQDKRIYVYETNSKLALDALLGREEEIAVRQRLLDPF
jgi:hypothetical protein